MSYQIISGADKSKLYLVTSLLFIIFCAGCGGNNEETAADPNPKNPVAGTRQSPPETIAPAPAVKAYPVTAEIRETYQWYCAQCHGIKGKGNGINAPHTAVPPRDHTKAAYLETRSDEQLFHVIKFGGLAGGRAPCMPRWGHTLGDDTIHSLVNYIRELCNCEYQ